MRCDATCTGAGAVGSVTVTTTYDYTSHGDLVNRTGFIHMNGRVYDPRIGRFVSPDPIVQAPFFSQSHNRYSYTLNSPLSRVDPSGFEFAPSFNIVVLDLHNQSRINESGNGGGTSQFREAPWFFHDLLLGNLEFGNFYYLGDEAGYVASSFGDFAVPTPPATNNPGPDPVDPTDPPVSPPVAPEGVAGGGSDVVEAITAATETIWVFRATIEGAGRSTSILTKKRYQRVRVLADDSVASAHFQSFTCELAITPVRAGMSASPVYEIDVSTGAFNLSPLNTDVVFPGDVHERARWTFTIQEIRNSNCGNCGKPVLTIFTEEVRP